MPTWKQWLWTPYTALTVGLPITLLFSAGDKWTLVLISMAAGFFLCGVVAGFRMACKDAVIIAQAETLEDMTKLCRGLQEECRLSANLIARYQAMNLNLLTWRKP